jgi:chromosome segregation protein
VASVTEEGFAFDPDRGELWFAGETAEAVLLEMDARRRMLADETVDLEAQARAAATGCQQAATAAQAAEAAYAEVAHLRDRHVDRELLECLVALTGTAEESLARTGSSIVRLEAPLEAQASSRGDSATTLASELRRLADLEAIARRDLNEAVSRAQEAEVVVARLGGAVAGVTVGEGEDRAALASEAATLLLAAEEAARSAREAADRARAQEAALAERAPRQTGTDPDLLRRLVAMTTELGSALERAETFAERLQSPVRARVDAGATRATELGTELRRLGASEVELRQSSEAAAERVTAVEIELARLDGEAAEARRRLEEAGAEEPAQGDDRAELAARLARIEQRRRELGMVNPLAKEEYQGEKLRLEDLARQRQDLEDSLRELEKLRDELAETVERRFDDTFSAVAENFIEVASTLFPGGEGRLRLMESEEEGVEPGIEVELRPAGKKITRLSLLSGGEKALGAISFLFALFLAKPCPFYLLDEVEAALDDTNIGRFVELLRSYSERAQFVVITHQKRTMEAADVLYGVTMGGDGVSQIVSRRLPRHERELAAAAPA